MSNIELAEEGVVRMTKSKFIKMLPKIRGVARALGYTIAIHGTFDRDYDLVAIPWIKEAVDSDTLAMAVYKAAGAIRWRCWQDDGVIKPHGRKTYCFDWDRENYESKNYCDLSVMPRK